MKKYLILLILPFLFGFNVIDQMRAVVVLKNNNSCYGCAGNGSFLWGCDSTTVGSGTCECSDNDTTATASGSNETITAGQCVYNDTSNNGIDYYQFDAPSTTIDNEGTVFIKFTLATYVYRTKLFQLSGGGTDYIIVRLTGGDDIEGVYSGNGTVDTITLTGNHVTPGTYIVRLYWKQGIDGDDFTISLYSSIGSLLETKTEDDDLVAFISQPSTGDLYIGAQGSTQVSYNYSIDYIHLYEGNQASDPNI